MYRCVYASDTKLHAAEFSHVHLCTSIVRSLGSVMVARENHTN